MSTLPKTLYFMCTINEKEPGFIMPTGLPVGATKKSRVRLVVETWSVQGIL